MLLGVKTPAGPCRVRSVLAGSLQAAAASGRRSSRRRRRFAPWSPPAHGPLAIARLRGAVLALTTTCPPEALAEADAGIDSAESVSIIAKPVELELHRLH